MVLASGRAWPRMGHIYRWALALLFLAMIGPASSAIIGPTNDWIPISDALDPCTKDMPANRACGLGGDHLNALLSAGVRVNCPDSGAAKGGVLNGWFLENSIHPAGTFFTSAHAFLNRQGGVNGIDNCRVKSYANPDRDFRVDRRSIKVVERDYGRDVFSDRASATTQIPIPYAAPLPLGDAYSLRDKHVFMISLDPPEMVDLVIQSCAVKFVDSKRRLLDTDCDSAHGNSGGLLFTVDEQSAAVVAVGLLKGAIYPGSREGKPGVDYLEWDYEKNTTLNLMLTSSSFFRDMKPLPEEWR